MFRTKVGSFRFRMVVSTVAARNAAPKGSLFLVLGFSADGTVNCCTADGPSSAWVDVAKSFSLPKIFVDDSFRDEEVEEALGG